MSLLPGLLSQQGKYALIHGSELAGVYETYDDALKVGFYLLWSLTYLAKG